MLATLKIACVAPCKYHHTYSSYIQSFPKRVSLSEGQKNSYNVASYLYKLFYNKNQTSHGFYNKEINYLCHLAIYTYDTV